MRRWRWLTCVPSLVACGGGEDPRGPDQGGTCSEAPAIQPLVPSSRARSTVGLSISVPLTLVTESVATWLPRTIAEGKSVPAGAAGRATFEIKRGEPTVEVTSGGVSASLKLDGDIRLCKPFGPVCVEYGRCRPEWTARVHIDAPWYVEEAPNVALDVDVTRGCVLSPVKFDATRELEKITREEVAKIRKRIRSEVHKHHATMGAEIEDIARQLRLTESGSPHVSIDTIALGLTRDDVRYQVSIEAAGELSTGDVSGAAAAEGPGDPIVHPSPALSLLTRRAKVTTDAKPDPGTQLYLEQPVALSALVAAWQPQLSSQQVRATATGSQILVEVTPWKTCASAWVLFQPEFTSNAVVLTPIGMSDPELVAILPTPPSLTQPAGAQTAILRRLENQWLQPVTLESNSSRERLRITFQPALALAQSVRVESDALILTGSIQGKVAGAVAATR